MIPRSPLQATARDRPYSKETARTAASHSPPRCSPPRGNGFASSVPTPGGAWATSSSPWTRSLHREVALKQILDRHADDPTSRARFLSRPRSRAGWSIPGSCPSTAWASYADGRPYYAMRFIQGETPQGSHRATSTPTRPSRRDPGERSLELRKLLRRFLDVCNAIDYAHSRGVLHRDLKPAQHHARQHGETLVVDWGLAKPLGRAEPDDPATSGH